MPDEFFWSLWEPVEPVVFESAPLDTTRPSQHEPEPEEPIGRRCAMIR